MTKRERIEYYDKGDYYEGEVKDEKRHGKGTMHYHCYEELKLLEEAEVEHDDDDYTELFGDEEDSSEMGLYLYKIYVGEWKNDKRHGKGKLTYPYYKKSLEPHNKTIKYVGEWKNDQYHGQGTEKFFIECFNKERELDLNEAEYVGAWKNGKKDGKGNLTSKNTFVPNVGKEKYVGEWKNDKRNGRGTQVFGANKYVGEWKNDKYHGQGTLHQAHGYKYTGEWKNGLAHGKGSEKFMGGVKYVGEFKNNKPHGQGVAIYPNKSKKEGMWHEGDYVDVDESKKN